MRPSPAVVPCRAVLAALGLALASAPALAEDPAYVGTWASDLAQCKNPQETQDAPMVVAKDRYDQHEVHCAFTSIEGAAPDWKVKADCTVEGSSEPLEFTLTASGDTLTVTDDTGGRDLQKCP